MQACLFLYVILDTFNEHPSCVKTTVPYRPIYGITVICTKACLADNYEIVDGS